MKVDKNLETSHGTQIIELFNFNVLGYSNAKKIKREYNGNIKEIDRDRKPSLVAVLEAAGLDDLWLNYQWFVTLRPLFGNDFIAAGERDSAAIRTEKDEYTGAIILPIRK